MTDRDALLEAIFAAPDDDAPRLIYADWLEEHGEPAQAAFIRGQLGRSPVAWQADPVEQAFELRREMADLFESGRFATFISYERGLPNGSIRAIDVPRLREESPHWWPRIPVRSLRVALTPMSVREFIRIPYLARLRELRLDGGDPHSLIVPLLVRCHLLRDLRILDLTLFTLGIEAAEALADTDLFAGLTELRLPLSMRPNRQAGLLLREKYGDAAIFGG